MPAATGGRQHLAPAGQAQDFDFQSSFLVDLAMQRGVQRFAEFDPAAGQRVESPGRRAGAADQQNLAVAKDRAADRELGTGWLDGGGQGVMPKSGNRFFGPDHASSTSEGLIRRERFQAKWEPVRVKKTRQNQTTESGLVARHDGFDVGL